MGILIKARTVSEAWEKAVLKCWENGSYSNTEYGESAKEILGMMIVIEKPFDEPRIHRGDIHVAVKGSLEKYYDEVINGTLDYAVKEKKIHYTYHERLFDYQPEGINQINYLTDKLSKSEFSRRAQAITWNPSKDIWISSPPCLQRLWCTVRSKKLIMHAMWRSRDVFRAMHMNILAITKLQQLIANRMNLEVGSYVDFTNSAHIYKKSYTDTERFIEVLRIKGDNQKNNL